MASFAICPSSLSNGASLCKILADVSRRNKKKAKTMKTISASTFLKTDCCMKSICFSQQFIVVEEMGKTVCYNIIFYAYYIGGEGALFGT